MPESVNMRSGLLPNFAESCILISLLTLPATPEGCPMELFLALMVSVAANVVSYYFCKWLDEKL